MISSEVPYSAHDSSSPRSRGRECGRRLQQLQTANDRRVKRIDRSKKHLGTTTRGPNLVLLSLDFDKNNTCAVFVDIRYVHICTYLCVCVCVCVYPFFLSKHTGTYFVWINEARPAPPKALAHPHSLSFIQTFRCSSPTALASQCK